MKSQTLQAAGLERTLILIDLYRDRIAHCRQLAQDEPDDAQLTMLLYHLADLFDEVVQVTTQRLDAGQPMGDIARMLMVFSAAKDLSLLIR